MPPGACPADTAGSTPLTGLSIFPTSVSPLTAEMGPPTVSFTELPKSDTRTQSGPFALSSCPSLTGHHLCGL